jgi:TnpA family transposase
VGRIERTLFTLQWLSDPALRQRSHAGLNKGEASNSLRRAVFFHRQGEFRDRTFENQSFRASGLSLLTAAIVHWNTRSRHRTDAGFTFSGMEREHYAA